jgi:hypothetical protein
MGNKRRVGEDWDLEHGIYVDGYGYKWGVGKNLKSICVGKISEEESMSEKPKKEKQIVASARVERETIVNFNEGEETVNVFTYNRRWQRRMKEMGVEPIRVEGNAKEYEFPKKWLRMPVKAREISPAAREAAKALFKSRVSH